MRSGKLLLAVHSSLPSTRETSSGSDSFCRCWESLSPVYSHSTDLSSTFLSSAFQLLWRLRSESFTCSAQSESTSKIPPKSPVPSVSCTIVKQQEKTPPSAH